MFCLLLVVLLFLTAVAVGWGKYSTENKKVTRYGGDEWQVLHLGGTITSTILGVIVCFWLIIGGSSLISGQGNNLRKLDEDYKKEEIIKQRRQDVERDIKSQLDKYPDIEKQIFGSINPTILVQFPQLKSNETITAAFTALNDINNEVAALHIEINEQETAIRYRERSPSSIKIPGLFLTYRDYFNRDLP